MITDAPLHEKSDALMDTNGNTLERPETYLSSILRRTHILSEHPSVPVSLPARLLPWLLFPLFVLAALLVERSFAPLPQTLDFHAFADTRSLASVPNFMDVVSNLAIIIPAIAGLGLTLNRSGVFTTLSERIFALVFFAALAVTAVGSTWYHLVPNNERLLFDRLPLALAFTAYIAWLIVERIRPHPAGSAMLLPWLITGPACALWWYASPTDDLRFYLLLYGTILTLAPWLMTLRTPYDLHGRHWAAYFVFVLAMICDRLDHIIHDLLGSSLSGHTLKHLLAGLAIFLLAGMLVQRNELTPNAENSDQSR